MDEEQRALYDAYQALRHNLFWQKFLAELLRKREYYSCRLADAPSWEETCRLQGGLSVCRQLILWAEQMKKGEQ
jgi:hypothetical protein